MYITIFPKHISIGNFEDKERMFEILQDIPFEYKGKNRKIIIEKENAYTALLKITESCCEEIILE